MAIRKLDQSPMKKPPRSFGDLARAERRRRKGTPLETTIHQLAAAIDPELSDETVMQMERQASPMTWLKRCVMRQLGLGTEESAHALQATLLAELGAIEEAGERVLAADYLIRDLRRLLKRREVVPRAGIEPATRGSSDRWERQWIPVVLTGGILVRTQRGPLGDSPSMDGEVEVEWSAVN